MAQFLSSLIKLGIFFGILYLIFTNFGTFLIIVFILIAIIYFIIYQFKKKLNASIGGNNFRFTFDGQGNNFDFRDFEERFKQGGFGQNGFGNGGYNSFSEVNKAKEFFGFTSDPTKEDIKRKYKELARKYHPDVNNHGDELMKQLNHYKDVLLKAFPN